MVTAEETRIAWKRAGRKEGARKKKSRESKRAPTLPNIQHLFFSKNHNFRLHHLSHIYSSDNTPKTTELFLKLILSNKVT